MSGPPLLRAPPFPWVDATLAAVSVAAPGAGDPADAGPAIAAMAAARVGGRFWAAPAMPPAGRRFVLCPATAEEEQAMRARAAALDPAAAVWVRAPDNDLDPWSLLDADTRLIAAPGDEWSLLAAAAGVEVVDVPAAALRARLAAAIAGARYRDPFSGTAADAGAAIATLALWRTALDANRAIAVAAGMAWWKREAIGRFLWSPTHGLPRFLDEAAAAVAAARAASAGVAVWPSRAPAGLTEAAHASEVPLIAVEDGFVRSVGLGVNLHPPASVAIDRRGIHYDPSHPSDLEHLLATADFTPALVARAERLAATIVAHGISKYAAGAVSARVLRAAGRRTVLVAGQVEDDLSVRLGGGVVAGNLDLLARARAAEPDAHLLFKPHPDVDAGHRRGRVPDAALLAHADAIVRGEGMAALLARVDAVHVLTSLAGFEALLRGLEVVTHGQPFYAGWGLTRDLGPPIARRTRRLTRPELVAGTLILYPRYLDPETQLPCPPEVLLARFATRPRPRATWLTRARAAQGWLARRLGTSTG